MPAPLQLSLLLMAGFGLGTLFFGGLWLTVAALPRSRHPAVLAVASFWLRTAVVVAGFVLAFDRTWHSEIVCLCGFILARVVLARLVARRTAAP